MAIAGVAIASAALGAVSQINAGKAAKRAAAAGAAQERKLARERERISWRESTMMLGRQRAVTAAQGTTMEGSPLMVLEDATAEAELEALHIRQGGQARAGALIKQGSNAQSAGYMNAGSTLLGGVSRAFSMGAGGG
jgi:phage repressor protein C with HTH and peptisase S24 domain